jgi:hypothetical protein
MEIHYLARDDANERHLVYHGFEAREVTTTEIMATTDTSGPKAGAVTSATANSNTRADHNAAIAPSTRPQPQPWTKPEDREGWEVVARGRARRDRPPVGTALFVELTQEQAVWVRQAACSAGVTQVEVVRRLIDQARAASNSTTEAAG